MSMVICFDELTIGTEIPRGKQGTDIFWARVPFPDFLPYFFRIWSWVIEISFLGSITIYGDKKTSVLDKATVFLFPSIN